MKVLVILGHPRPGSFSETLAETYIKGAEEAGADVEYIRLYELTFDIHVTTKSLRAQHSEPDLLFARECVKRADHLVFVYPTWWATVPALLKGFLDRLLLPGFAFEEKDRNTDWIQLLKGKTAQLITTMDTPLWVYRILYRAPGTNAMRIGTLKYCGISPVRFLGFSPISYTTGDRHEKWLDRVYRQGLKLKSGVITPPERWWRKIKPWIKAVRLQFYPMTWLAYAMGAYAAARSGAVFDSLVFWAGYLFLFFLEAAVVFNNDFLDFESDRINKNYSPFTGGSRVLVDGNLNKNQLKKGSRNALSIAALFGLLILIFNGFSGPDLVVMGVLSILALGYTAPPLKLSYRTLGEVDVGVTHSIGVLLCGFVFQGGALNEPFPWLISLPLFLSIVPAIILAGIPDFEADRYIGKKTVAVRFGKKAGLYIAAGFVALSLVISALWYHWQVTGDLYDTAIWIIMPHGFLLLYLILKKATAGTPPHRIDSLLIIALLYIFWFGLFPLIRLA